MSLKRVRPDVLIVPPGLVLELFALARFAGKIGLQSESLRVLLALRRMRPDVPEFSSYAAMLMLELGHDGEARSLLDEYLASGFGECSLVLALLAYLHYRNHDPNWVSYARRSLEVAKQDGGGAHQSEVLALLPMEMLDEQ